MKLARSLAIFLTLATAHSWRNSVGQQPRQPQQERPTPRRVSIMGPTTSGGQPRQINPPSLDQILVAMKDEPAYAKTIEWAETNQRNLKVTQDKIADYIDPPRFYPILGPAQLHHAHYRVSLRTDNDVPARVVFVDHNHFHSLAEASVTIRTGSPPCDRSTMDKDLCSLLEDWNHTTRFFGPVDIKRRGDTVVVVAKPAKLSLRLSPAIRFLAEGNELTIRFSADRTLTGTFQGDVQLNRVGESLRCDDLTFSSDGRLTASGNVQLIGRKKKADGQLRLGNKPLGVTKATVFQRLPGGDSPIANFVADSVELDMNKNTITVRPTPIPPAR